MKYISTAKLPVLLSKIWAGLIIGLILGLCWLSTPYIGSALYLEWAGQSLAENNHQAAIRYLETALRFESGNALAYRHLAHVYLQLDEPAQALVAAKQAALISPDNPLAQLELGDVYDRLGDIEQAIASYETGQVNDRKSSLLVNYLELADKLWLIGDHKKASTIWHSQVLDYSYTHLYANWRLFQYYSLINNSKEADFYKSEVSRFHENSLLLSSNQRLADYQIEAIVGVIKDNLWKQETVQGVLAYKAWQDNSPPTELLFQRLTERDPFRSDGWYYQGEYYRHQGLLELAEKSYQKAVEISPQEVLAYQRLGLINEVKFKRDNNRAWLNQADTWYRQYHHLAPTDPLALKKLAVLCQLKQCSANPWLSQLEDYLTKRQPEFIVEQQIGNRILFGYDVDEARLTRGEPTSLWIYWQGMADTASTDSNSNFYQLGQRQVQVVEEAQNLVLNGGFEVGRAPFGFPHDLYNELPLGGTFVTTTRNGHDTTAALLTNEEYSQTSLVTNGLPIDPTHLYLQIGWMRSEGGNGFLGRGWISKPGEGSTSYGYVVESVNHQQWNYYTALVHPPPDAIQIQVWLLNYESRGNVYFDNISLVDIGKPE